MLGRKDDRALAALLGIAIGDALGMPSQSMDRAAIIRTYGRIEGFVDAADSQPIARGLPAGTITDDTEQTILLARHLIERGGVLDPAIWAQELLDWEADTRARNVNDLLGPSTKRAIAALQAGEGLDDTGRFGTTNGAAMRVMPVAIASPATPLAELIDWVEETCRLTHNTSVAIGAAAAVACVASAGIDGASFEEALPAALEACRLAERRGVQARGAQISEALARALSLTDTPAGMASEEDVVASIGTTVAAIESVPAAFAIVRLAKGDPWHAAMVSANVGGDTDTIGAIACGMAAACAGTAGLPASAVETVTRTNGLELEGLASDLLRLREIRAMGARASDLVR